MATCGGLDKNFIDTPPDELVCLICQTVADNPYQLICCGKLYCKSCLDRQKKVANSCPTCRRPIQSFQDHLSSRRIKTLRVWCDNERYGCQWEGELMNLKGHVLQCRHNAVPCKLCSQRVLRSEIVSHLKTKCMKRRYNCPHCNEQGTYVSITTTHCQHCPNIEIWCPNLGCSKIAKRCKMPAHRRVCPKEKVACTYSGIGCQATTTRESLAKHISESMEQHLTCAVEEITAMKSTPPVVFKLEGLETLKTTKDEWYSPPFYSHRGGYKMCLSVSTTSSGDDCHLSLWIYLIGSKNDKDLIWPFRGEVHVDLLNQHDDKGHYSHIFNYTSKELDSHNVTIKADEKSRGWGIEEFMAYSSLESNASNHTQYLQDDILYFRVSRVNVFKSNKPWLTCTN